MGVLEPGDLKAWKRWAVDLSERVAALERVGVAPSPAEAVEADKADVQEGYDAVFAVIRSGQQSERPSSIEVNALIWRAVHAFRDALGIPAVPEPSPVQVEAERCAYCGDEIDDATGTWRSLGDFGGTGTGSLIERFWCADAPDHKHSPLPAPAEDDPIEALVQEFSHRFIAGVGDYRAFAARVLEVGGQRPGVPRPFTPCEHGNKYGECVLVFGHEKIRSDVVGGPEFTAPMHVDRFGQTWNVRAGS